jgi:hypothetical protein
VWGEKHHEESNIWRELPFCAAGTRSKMSKKRKVSGCVEFFNTIDSMRSPQHPVNVRKRHFGRGTNKKKEDQVAGFDEC